MDTRNQTKLFLTAVLGDWCYNYFFLRARNHSSERFGNLPKVTQPDLVSQVSPRIFQTPSLRPHPLLHTILPHLSSPRAVAPPGPSFLGVAPASLLNYCRGTLHG